MIDITNSTNNLVEIQELEGAIYCTCAACLSVYSDFLSWANANPNRMVKNPSQADNIIVLSCQVTDLAIRNDLIVLKKLMEAYPDKHYFVGGCLAQRADIQLPDNVFRLNYTRADKTFLDDKTLVNLEKPFWVKDLNETNEFSDGMLFRNMYPLRIGVGCSGKCVYCTIKHTRGTPYQIPTQELFAEFLGHDDIVLIADSPSRMQLLEWISVANTYEKPISIRNVEPDVLISILPQILNLSRKGLLKILHCPIQSCGEEILKYMRRDYKSVNIFLEHIHYLDNYGTIVATNIIIDINDYPNSSLEYQLAYLEDYFDYISWNPMWMGNYDAVKADERFKKYINI
jgi:tRNA A37 methylthiotransferase MiaB